MKFHNTRKTAGTACLDNAIVYCSLRCKIYNSASILCLIPPTFLEFLQYNVDISVCNICKLKISYKTNNFNS